MTKVKEIITIKEIAVFDNIVVDNKPYGLHDTDGLLIMSDGTLRATYGNLEDVGEGREYLPSKYHEINSGRIAINLNDKKGDKRRHRLITVEKGKIVKDGVATVIFNKFQYLKD